MSFIASYLSFFQFDNLVNSRVPFALLTLDPSVGKTLNTWYTGVFQMHLENQIITCTRENFLEQIELRKLPPHVAIVLLCSDGKLSTEVAQVLEEKGFMNGYVARGGLQQLTLERSELKKN